jgi:hypothetical protein
MPKVVELTLSADRGITSGRMNTYSVRWTVVLEETLIEFL